MVQKTITFVTSNEQKLKEVKTILGTTFPHEIVARHIDLIEIQGDIEEVCIKKCLEAVKILRKPVIVEDTSLCFNALDGLPGPYIKWFLEKLRPEGLNKMLLGWEDKSAEAVCTYAFCAGGEDCSDFILFQGKTKGTIVPPRGPRAFGWDCIFQPDNYEDTYAEMTRQEKNKISHRSLALEKMKSYFLRNEDCI